MEAHALLAPVAVLVLWSLLVLTWMTVTRFKAFAGAGVNLLNVEPGGRYVDVEPELPTKVSWVSHNFTHLMEQPTIFYAVVVVLVLAGDTSSINPILAWAYVGLRIVHSLWQILLNIVAVRAALFGLATFCLFGLAVNAVRLTVL